MFRDTGKRTTELRLSEKRRTCASTTDCKSAKSCRSFCTGSRLDVTFEEGVARRSIPHFERRPSSTTIEYTNLKQTQKRQTKTESQGRDLSLKKVLCSARGIYADYKKRPKTLTEFNASTELRREFLHSFS